MFIDVVFEWESNLSGQFFDNHLKFIVLNKKQVNWLEKNLTYLEKVKQLPDLVALQAILVNFYFLQVEL